MLKKWYKLCLVLFMVFTLILPTEQAMAAEKQLQVTLDKDYVACEFKIVFENPGNYEAKLIDTYGNEHSYARVDDVTMTCSLDKTPKGVYSTYITCPDVEDIGKVTLSVVTNYSSSTDIVSDNIMIGKDISGLNMYFKDDTFIATWKDETCGSVDIKVINLDTSETIKNEKVTDKTFECEITNDVKQISVTIVPSSSSNIKGAELTYNFNIDNNPDAKVTFPDVEKTNQDSISVKVVMGSTYGVYVEDNGECVLTTDLMVKGTYDIEVPLEDDGTNEILFYIVDTDGNMRSTYKTIYKDTVAPSLSLEEEYDGITVNALDYTIIGTVANYDTLAINGETIEAATDGYFECPLTLHWGENKITVEASDNSGNVTSYNIVIMAEEPKFEVNSIVIVAAILIVVVGIISYIRKRRKGKDIDDDENIDNIEKMDVEDEKDEKDEKNVTESKKKKTWFKKKKTKSKEDDDPFKMPSEFSESSDTEEDTDEMEEDESEDEYDIGEYETVDDDDEQDAEDEEASEYEEGDIYEYDEDNEDDEDDLSEIATSATTDPIFSSYTEDIDESEEIEETDCLDKTELLKEEDSSSKWDSTEDSKEPEPDSETLIASQELEEPTGTIEPAEIESVENGEKSNEHSSVVAAEYKSHIILRSRLSKKQRENVKVSDEEFDMDDSDTTNDSTDSELGTTQTGENAQTVINIITDKPIKTQEKKYPHIVGDILYLVTIVVLLFCLFHFVLLNGWIESGSMEPTLMVGDLTIANRLAYKHQTPQRGDIIFFEKDGELLSKRVIGIAGDTITFVDGKVVINDEVLDESEYLAEEIRTECEKTFEVPRNCVFVLGDNREDSYDSRYWDEPYVRLRDIEGKLISTIPLGKNSSEIYSRDNTVLNTEEIEDIP